MSQYLSQPEYLVPSALAIELLFLFRQTIQFYEHTVFFPPLAGERGTLASLMHAIFFWSPRVTSSVYVPEFKSFYLKSHLWEAIAWW